MSSIHDRDGATESHRVLRSFLIWSAVVTSAAGAGAIGAMLDAETPATQAQSSATADDGVTASDDATGADFGVLGEPYFDHAFAIMQGLPPKANAGPRAIALLD
jgi:hypothetical protein